VQERPAPDLLFRAAQALLHQNNVLVRQAGSADHVICSHRNQDINASHHNGSTIIHPTTIHCLLQLRITINRKHIGAGSLWYTREFLYAFVSQR